MSLHRVYMLLLVATLECLCYSRQLLSVYATSLAPTHYFKFGGCTRKRVRHTARSQVEGRHGLHQDLLNQQACRNQLFVHIPIHY